MAKYLDRSLLRTSVKLLPKTLLVLYLLTLLWLVLFKLSFDFLMVLDYQARSLNIVPFAGNLREAIDNLLVFIPLGLLLSVNFKHPSFWQKLTFILLFSLTAEIIQYVLAIGVTDITDVIMNTLGGFLGLALYSFSNKYVGSKQDRPIVIVGVILFIIFLLLRFFVFKVRY